MTQTPQYEDSLKYSIMKQYSQLSYQHFDRLPPVTSPATIMPVSNITTFLAPLSRLFLQQRFGNKTKKLFIWLVMATSEYLTGRFRKAITIA